jgi:periplasmic divalent cation tolerance protein
MPETLLVITTLPDQDAAERLAEMLVETGLAACVNIGAAVTSIYRWDKQLQRGSELMLTIKTTRARYPALEQAIVDGHPYELPEVIAIPITAGLSEYLAWIEACTKN